MVTSINYVVRLAPLLLFSSLVLIACGKSSLVSGEQDSSVAVVPSTSASPSVEASASPSTTASAIGQTYQEADGAFQISFPEEYLYEKTPTGVIFHSKDQSFRGEVVFGSAQGEKYSNQQLEAFLKEAYKENLKLSEVNWQQTEAQPDGSLRIDWIGKDPQGNVLDAESFIEQRGDTIYILTLSGINKPYQDYFADAQAIVGSYQIRKQEEQN